MSFLSTRLPIAAVPCPVGALLTRAKRNRHGENRAYQKVRTV